MDKTLALNFVLIGLAFTAWGVVHSLMASLEAKALVRRLFGRVVEWRWYRLFYNLFSVFSFTPILALAASLPDQALYRIPFPWLWITLAIQAVSALAVLYAVAQTGMFSFIGLQQIFSPPPTEAGAAHQFISGGLYRFVRHPIYFFGILFIWLNPAMSWNGLAFNLGATAYFILGAVFEERKLVREFGRQYLDYRQRVPFLIPRPW